jgi:translation initiation factor 3 subunit F
MTTAAPVQLSVGASSVGCKLHPVVLFNILDHFTRRNEGQERVIGTLLGAVTSDGTIEVKNCFPVPHTENAEQVAVDTQFQDTMFGLHRRVNPKEVVVGWYATGTSITDQSVYIHDFYGQQCAQPLHLIVDTSLTSGKMGLKAFVNVPLIVDEKLVGAQFQRMKLDIKAHETEKIGVNYLCHSERWGPSTKLGSGMETLEASIKKLLAAIDVASAYVQDVLSGKTTADDSIGRVLSEAVAAVPKMDAAAFERMFNSSLQDLLMVVYLGSLTRTQLALSQKLQTATI